MGKELSQSEMQEQKLQALMKSYQDGEPAAFEALYQGLKSRLYQYLVAQTLNRTLAEDLLQETFLQIHRSRGTYLPGKPVTPWAFAIARHVYLMAHRAKVRRRRHEIEGGEDLPELPIPPKLEALAEEGLVRTALLKLAAEQREAVLMYHVWGFTFREIGAVLGIRKGTAKLRAFRGIINLRKALGISLVTNSGNTAK